MTDIPSRLDRDTPFGSYAPKGFDKSLLDFARAMPPGGLPYRLALAVQRIFLNRWGEGPVDAVSFGQKIRFYPQDNVCERRSLLTPQRFDPEERAMLAEVLDPGGVFVDLGANAGFYSLSLAPLVGPEGIVLSIEPQPEVFGRLSHNISLNGLTQIRARQLGVSDEPGELTLYQSTNNRGEATVAIADRMVGEGTTITVKPLLTLLAEEGITRVDGLKIDIEGHEDAALFPFMKEADDALLPKVIVSENSWSEWQRDWVGAAKERGYALVLDGKRNIVLRRGSSSA